MFPLVSQASSVLHAYKDCIVLSIVPNIMVQFAVEGSTILLASRTMLGECYLAAIQPKGFWTKLRAQERERVCVCV